MDLETLAAARGAEWIRGRDRLAKRSAGRVPASPRLRIVAAILAAWKAHGRAFRAFLKEIDAVDVAAEAQTRLGMFGPISRMAGALQHALGPGALPFCWERALKFQEDASWQVAVFHHAMRLMPAAESVEPLLWALDEATTAGQVDAIHQTLIALPFAAFHDRLQELKRASKWRAFVAEDLLARFKPSSAKP